MTGVPLTGRWIGRGVPTSLFQAARAEAIKIERYDKNDGILTVRAPLANLDPDEGDPFYMLQMLSVGGPMTLTMMGEAGGATLPV